MNPSFLGVRGSISAKKPENTGPKKDPRDPYKEPPGILYMACAPDNHASRSLRSLPCILRFGGSGDRFLRETSKNRSEEDPKGPCKEHPGIV